MPDTHDTTDYDAADSLSDESPSAYALAHLPASFGAVGLHVQVIAASSTSSPRAAITDLEGPPRGAA